VDALPLTEKVKEKEEHARESSSRPSIEMGKSIKKAKKVRMVALKRTKVQFPAHQMDELVTSRRNRAAAVRKAAGTGREELRAALWSRGCLLGFPRVASVRQHWGRCI